MGRLRPYLRLLLASPIFRSVALLSGAAAAAQALLVLASPVLTRLFTPAEFGALAVFSTCAGIAGAVACFRFDLAVPIAGTTTEARALTRLSALLAVASTLVVAVLVWAVGDRFVEVVRTPALDPWIWLLPPTVLSLSLYQLATNRALRGRGYAVIGRSRLVQSAATVVTQMAGGALLWGAPGLILGLVVGHVLAFVQVLLTMPREREEGDEKGTVGLRAVATRYGSFAAFSSGSALVNTMGLLLPLPLLAAFAGPEVAGWYALCHRVLGLPVYLVGQAMGQVFLAEAPRLVREDPPRLRRLFFRTARSLALAGALPMILLAPAYPILFAAVFGAEWRAAGIYALLLAAATAARIVVSPLATLLVVLERQGTQLLWDAGRLVLTVVVIVAGSYVGLSSATIVGLLGGVGLLSYGALFLMCVRVLSGVVPAPGAGDEGGSTE